MNTQQQVWTQKFMMSLAKFFKPGVHVGGTFDIIPPEPDVPEKIAFNGAIKPHTHLFEWQDYDPEEAAKDYFERIAK